MSKPAQQKTQAQPAPQDPRLQVGPTPAERIHAAQEEFVRVFIRDYSGRTPNNPDGKSFRDWDATDFFRLSERSLSMIRALFIEEHYDLIDKIKPTSMSRPQFARAILREAARRGDVMDYYERRMPFERDERLTDRDSLLGTSRVTVTRPQDPEAQHRVTVTESPAFITARDAAVGILRNPRLASINVQPDVGEQAGLRPDALGRLPGFDILTDTAVYDLGYTMGAAKQNRPNGSTPLELLFDQGSEQIRYGYCVVTNDMYAQRGRVTDQQEAFSAGWLQGRQDTRTNFEAADVRIGVLGDVCPASTPAVTGDARLMLALRNNEAGRSSN